MDNIDIEFKDELHRIIDSRINDEIQVVNAVVVSIDEENYTIDIERGPFKRTGISLRSDSKSKKGIIVIPTMSSNVTLYIQRHHYSEYIRILNYGDIDKYIININDMTNIIIKDDSVSILCNKLYLNTEVETEPVVKGETLKSNLDTIYDLIIDLYNRLNTIDLERSTQVGTVMFDPQIIPLITLRLVEYASKIVEVTTNKSLTYNIKSLKNFTE